MNHKHQHPYIKLELLLLYNTLFYQVNKMINKILPLKLLTTLNLCKYTLSEGISAHIAPLKTIMNVVAVFIQNLLLSLVGWAKQYVGFNAGITPEFALLVYKYLVLSLSKFQQSVVYIILLRQRDFYEYVLNVLGIFVRKLPVVTAV
ncbi:unnamed protein product [Paramecium pentaurelia]|uniref:Uncharacterized protein n=1 Tax=Paramecium pentaurelia TaxID=43138 RepID=A0A8S1XNM8_9CILI|nr:unnamed protein product [Paramecium pentaurelia]